jgi:hypothetical protein
MLEKALILYDYFVTALTAKHSSVLAIISPTDGLLSKKG